MLEDFYSDFFPTSPGVQGLRESCRPSANPASVSRQAAWAEQPEPEPLQSRSSAADEALLCRESFVRVAGSPGAGGGGEPGGPAARGWSRRPPTQPARRRGEASAGFTRQERRGPGKVARLAAPAASRSASPDSGRAPSPELLVPDSDYMEEDSESQWQHCLRPGGGGQPGGRPTPTSRADPGAGLPPAAGAGPARPLLWPEGEEAIGGCGRSASPRSLADLEDQVVTDCWLPEE